MPLHRDIVERISSNDAELVDLDLSYQSLEADDLQKLMEVLAHNTSLTSLNLTGNHLEDEGAVLLAQHTPLVTLSLAANKVGVKGATALAQHKSLRSLDISHNQIGDEGITALAKNNILMTLNAADNMITASGAWAFADNITLSELILSENRIDEEGARGLACNKTLLSLNLTKNHVRNRGAAALAWHPALTTLILYNNNINDKGAAALARNAHLKVLDLSYNKISPKAMEEFAKNVTLRTLKLSGNKITNWGTALLASNQALTELNLSYCQISDEGVYSVSKIQSLLCLDLSYNQITHVSMQALSRHPALTQLNIPHNLLNDHGAALLAQSRTLTSLNLANNHIGGPGADALSKNRVLHTLILSYNLVSDVGAIALAKNKSLKELWLSFNEIGDAGAKALAQNPTLELLGLNCNLISPEGQTALHENKAFKTLLLSEDQSPVMTSSENFHTLFLFSQDFLCIRNQAGIIQFFNPNFSRVLGYWEDDLLGKSFYDFLHPEDRLKEEKRVNAEEGEAGPFHENRYRCKNGFYCWIRWSNHVKNNYIYAIGSDISYEKNMEEELSKKDKQIENHTLQAKLADIYVKEQADFIAHLCHELRNPLSGIVGNVEIIEGYLEDLKSALDRHPVQLASPLSLELIDCLENIQQCLRSINLCTDYQQNILDDNLDIAKLAEKKFTLENKIFDVKKSLLDVVHMFQAKAEQKKLQLNLILPDEELLVKGDASRLKQVVINLVGNAIKFTQHGHIDIQVIIQGKTPAYTQLEIKVIDTGVGLTEEESCQVFKRFRQGSANVAGEYGGSGLGLLIAKSIAQLMGGDIRVTSKKGKGSVFCCVVQCQNLLESERRPTQTALSTVSPATLEARVPLLPLQLLIVEDNEINRKVLGVGLKKAGYTYEFAINGKEAVEKYKQGAYDVILMDIIMPEMNGIEATQIIRQYEQAQNRPKTPIIALTGNALAADRKKARDAGMDDYATKPFKIAVILQKIAAVVRSSTAEPKKTSADKMAARSKFGLFKLPAAQRVHGQLPNSNKMLEFSEEKISSAQGDCGFIALGTDRSQLYEVLLTLQQDHHAREYLSEEIKAAFMEEAIKPTIEWLELYRIYTEQQLSYDQTIRNMPKPGLSMSINTADERVQERLEETSSLKEGQFLRELRAGLLQAEEKLDLYCKTPVVYNYYLQQLRDTPLWLGYKSAMLYAKQQSMNLYVWQKAAAEDLTCMVHHETDAPKNSVHILHTCKFTHFNLLVVTRESFPQHDDPDLNLEETVGSSSLTK